MQTYVANLAELWLNPSKSSVNRSFFIHIAIISRQIYQNRLEYELTIDFFEKPYGEFYFKIIFSAKYRATYSSFTVISGIPDVETRPAYSPGPGSSSSEPGPGWGSAVKYAQ